jgi:hypothetical protein
VETLLLLEMPDHDRARSKLAEKGVDVDAELQRAVCRTTIVEVDLWNPGNVARVLITAADRLTAKGKGPLWANISTGPNPWCVAATLAASFADVQVFHVDRDGSGIRRIPTIRQERPTDRELAVLGVLPADGSEISGTLLKKRLRETGFFRDSTSDKPAKNREQGQLNYALPRLVQWGAIGAGFHGPRRWYKQGPAGPTLSAMFG